MTADDRDRLIAAPADSELQLARQLAAYREVLSVALAQLHEVGRQLDRLKEQHYKLRDECRRLREQVRRDGRRAAA